MSEIERLLSIMARLRDPERGCAWDLEQTFESIAPYTIEEAYEVEHAIRTGDAHELRDELGDLLLQVVFHAQMAAERSWFDFGSVCEAISEKLVRRHPHLFEVPTAHGAREQVETWEQIKARERADRAARSGRVASVLDDVPANLPGLTRAAKLAGRAARAGFRWPDAAAALDKLDEEIAELRAAASDGEPREIAHELGDVFFAAVVAGRELGADCDAVVRAANARFEARLREVEQALAARGLGFGDASIATLLELWRASREAPGSDSARD